MILKKSPYLLYADPQGNTFEDRTLYALGRSGWDALDVPLEEWIEIPNGGTLYTLPDRQAIGIDVKTGEVRVCEKGRAVSAFVPPAYTVLRLVPYVTLPEATPLPLYCYSAVGWAGGKIYVAATRIEQDIRQEAAGYDDAMIEAGIEKLTAAYPHIVVRRQEIFFSDDGSARSQSHPLAMLTVWAVSPSYLRRKYSNLPMIGSTSSPVPTKS